MSSPNENRSELLEEDMARGSSEEDDSRLELEEASDEVAACDSLENGSSCGEEELVSQPTRAPTIR